jgi:hypothetical protein
MFTLQAVDDRARIGGAAVLEWFGLGFGEGAAPFTLELELEAAVTRAP